MKRFILSLVFVILSPALAFGGDAATLVFESGLVVHIQDGFQKIVNAMEGLNRESTDHRILTLSIGGSTFVLNISEVVVVCRDDCKPLTIKHKLEQKEKGRRY